MTAPDVRYTKENAPLFEKALPVCLDENDVGQIVDFIKDRLNNRGNFKLLDLGVGTGQVFIPLFKKFRERTTGFTATVVDNNVHMLECFRKNCLKQDVRVDTIKILQKEFEDFVVDDIDCLEEQDIILMTRVLHQLGNWRGFLEDLLAKWDARGVFVLTESFGDLYNALNFVEPKGGSQQATVIFQHLNDFFGTEHQIFFKGKGNIEISAIDMKPVKDFFESKGFRVEKLMEIKWIDKKNSWNDYLEFTRKRVFTPIFSPFSHKEDEYETKICLLDKKMRGTFKKYNWDLNAPVNEELGVSFFYSFKDKKTLRPSHNSEGKD
ncbi:MAG: class I SAM-dependent methyltransferase [Desulfobacteraceae bacterium]|nr:class I SAM-dependent methyltransferase [Desulfobacteraceae bacterium]